MGVVSSPSSPGPLVPPPRSSLTVRHMVGAVLAVVAMVLVVGGLTRGCSFSPTGPTVDPAGLPTVDAAAELRLQAPRVPFPLRVPVVPAGWRANAVSQDRVEGGRAVRVGYLTPEGRYLRVVQSDAREEALLATEAPGSRLSGTEAATPAGRGTVDVAGVRWVVYDEGGEPIRIAEVPTPGTAPVRMLITGSGTDDDFRALAEGAVTGELLAR
jgi:uncharacterized protein DUF4245